MAGLEELETHRSEFPYVLNIDSTLGQYWSTEGYTSGPAVSIYERLLMEAKIYRSLAQGALSRFTYTDKDRPSCDSKTKHQNASAPDPWYCAIDFDVRRGERAVAIAQNAWAWEVTQLPLEDSSTNMVRAAREASASAVRYYFQQIGGYDAASVHDSVHEIVQRATGFGTAYTSGDAGDFWGAVDTATYATVVQFVLGDGDKEQLACALGRWEEARRWFEHGFKEMVAQCTHGPQCKLRIPYALMDDTYQVIQGHIRLAEGILSDSGGVDKKCSESDKWRFLNRKGPE